MYLILSVYDMWSLVLVPVLDEKPCQQLLWDGGERRERDEAMDSEDRIEALVL